MTKQYLVFVSIVILFCLNLFAWAFVLEINKSAPLEVIFFDIGQGDAILIKVASFCQILIDGGPQRNIVEKLSTEMPFWDKKIDLIILTHSEKDHIEGLISVLETYEVDNILWTGVEKETEVFRAWEKALEQEGANEYLALAGQKIIVNNAEIEILHPFEILADSSLIKDVNRTSIVAKLIFKNISFLFTGDIYSQDEKNIIEQGSDLETDILKLAHHGSKTSTSRNFIEATLPKMAIVSCGKNNIYGHPHEQVLSLLSEYDINVLRTDINGDIKIQSNGQSFFIKN